MTLSHHNLVNNAHNIGYRIGYNEKVISGTKKYLVLDRILQHVCPQPHRICVSVPFYHCFGNVAGTLAGLVHGATNVVPCPRWISTLDNI